MSSSPDRWAALRRATPDPTAPSTLPEPWCRLHRIFGNTRLILTLLIYLPLLIARHFIFGPLLPWMPLSTLLLTRYIKMASICLRGRLPEVDEHEWTIPIAPFAEMRKRRIGEVVDIVRLPPIPDELRQGVAVCQWIKAVERPEFMITPPKSEGKGTEQAKQGERVILYFVGG